MPAETRIVEQSSVVKQGTLGRLWAWCRTHRLVTALLVVIAVQQLVIAGAVFVIHDNEERNKLIVRSLFLRLCRAESNSRLQDSKQAHDKSNEVHEPRAITIPGYCGTNSLE
jgi:hypothetical protein